MINMKMKYRNHHIKVKISPTIIRPFPWLTERLLVNKKTTIPPLLPPPHPHCPTEYEVFIAFAVTQVNPSMCINGENVSAAATGSLYNRERDQRELITPDLRNVHQDFIFGTYFGIKCSFVYSLNKRSNLLCYGSTFKNWKGRVFPRNF